MADKEPTRQELAEALAKANERIAQLETRPAAPAPQPGPQKIPYSGYVRTKEACWIGHLRSAGEVFQHAVPCLWSDDPFEAVILTDGVDKDGNPNCKAHPEAPKPIPFHLRPRSVDALSERGNTPLRASEW